jgi:hypothetical protein
MKFLELILKFLPYRSLNHVYHTCKGLRQAFRDSEFLGQALLVTPDLDSRPRFLPLKFLSSYWLPEQHPNNRPFLEIRHGSFERLCKESKLDIMERLISQPPFRRMDLELTLQYCVLTPRTARFQVRNSSGITLGDVIGEIDSLHVMLEHMNQENRVQCQRISVGLVGWRFAVGVEPIVRMLGSEVDS